MLKGDKWAWPIATCTRAIASDVCFFTARGCGAMDAKFVPVARYSGHYILFRPPSGSGGAENNERAEEKEND